MSESSTEAWTRVGLLGLPLYGALTIWSTLEAQPDQTVNPAAWAAFVASQGYVVDHVFGAIGGAVVAILAVVALASYLAGGRGTRLALGAMVVTVVGHALGLTIGGVSTFATPAVGRAYLAGITDVMLIEFPNELTAVFAIALLAMFVGNVLLGVAMWRSDRLPRWTGAVWIASAILFYLLGAVLGSSTTGASLPTQPVGAALMVVSGLGVVWTAFRTVAPTTVRQVAAG